jgi:methyl-accepting chemotaxis protein
VSASIQTRPTRPSAPSLSELRARYLADAAVASAGITAADSASAVKCMTDIMGEISAASAELAADIEQVSATVTHMDEATQQNAALVEEATAAARAMEDQAGRLAQNVARFRL